METLCAYHWPGNVRELRNVIEALLVNLSPEKQHRHGRRAARSNATVPGDFTVGAPTSERERLLNALTATNWTRLRPPVNCIGRA